MTDPYYTDESIRLYHGDCLQVLAELPDDSVDAVVTDPPYDLTAGKKGGTGLASVNLTSPAGRARITAGFMGKAWDGTGIAFRPDMWLECLRVLKPGGHLLAFGGSRTWHRLACAIEDAGFEIRDSIAWLYGCHDDRTEVLTRRGWVNGLDLTDGDDVAQWATDGTVTLVRPSARQRYPFAGRMVRFRNADVDQLVTPNHRVYRQVRQRVMVKGVRTASWSGWQVDEAGDVNRWQRMRLPAAGVHNGSGIGGPDYAALLGWVWAEGGFDLSGSGVGTYQSSVNQPHIDEIAALLDRLGPHKRYDYARTYTRRNGETHPHTATTWYVSGDLANRVRADLPGKAPTWGLLWRMTAAEKRALWDAAMKGDGSKEQRTFWQKDRAALEWAQALLASIGYRGKISDDPRGALHWTERPTVELQARHLADDGEDYTGEVWCVTVPSGAFLVRRQGRVSVSGNSGFPKSLDVSKAIDKAAGATRKVVGIDQRYVGMSETAKRAQGATAHEYSAGWVGDPSQITAPATEDATRWQGWGTALKPAHEPIVVARKPLTAAGVNVLAHVESSLRDQCVTGEIRWTSAPVSDVARPGQRQSSSSTARQSVAGTSASPVDAPVTLNDERPTDSGSATSTPSGATPTGNTSGPTPAARPLNCEMKSSPPMTTPAPAATSAPASSSPSTTSTVEEPPTARPHGARSTPRSGAKDSLPVTESFAGTATGLTGSRATVRIDRLADGTFVWPESLPRSVPGGPITVAANVLEWGTGALNIDGTRVGTGDDRTSGGATGKRIDAVEHGYGGGSWSDAAEGRERPTGGRWPTNVVLDDHAAAELDRQSGTLTSGAMRAGTRPKGELTTYGQDAAAGYETQRDTYADSGGASRFFPVFWYEAKAPTSERPRIPGESGGPVLRLRGDLTDEERAYMLTELERAGVDVA